MRVLMIVVEGPTEREFVTECIAPYFHDQGIYNIRPIGIETSPGNKGGDVRYARYGDIVKNLLKGQEDMIVTSLIDYYELRNDFPGFANAQALPTVFQRIERIEQNCYNDVNDPRFIPYIQLHEIEGLLFTKYDGFSLFQLRNQVAREIQQIIAEHPNPELINSHPDNAPSKRLDRLIDNYQKPFHGPIIALENGFDSILNKCTRFKAWIDNLVYRMQADTNP